MADAVTVRPDSSARPGARLRILATSDLHMALVSHDFHTDRANPEIGLTRTASLIAQARAEAETSGALVLLLDNGDGLQGSALDELATASPEGAHPLMRAFGHLRYDALGLGNHDFNHGLRALDAVLRQAPCPVVCSNMRKVNPATGAGFAPFAILDRIIQTAQGEAPIRIGVLSVLPPQTMIWDAHHLHGAAEVGEIVPSARHWSERLRHAGCDLIIALSHSGLGRADDVPGIEHATIPLAALHDIDVVIAGHTHLHLPGPAHDGLPHVDAQRGAIHGKPAVMPGAMGSHLGVIDLDLGAKDGGRWQIGGFRCELRAIARRDAGGVLHPLVEDSSALAALLAEDVARTRRRMAKPIGRSGRALHSYFTFFAPDHALALVAAAQAAALRPLLAGTEAASLPLLSVTSPFKSGGRAGPASYTDIPAGALSLRHIAELHPFPNDLRAKVLNGAQVLDWLEMSASLFHQVAPGRRTAPLVDPAIPGHEFDLPHGLGWRVDLSAPPRFGPDGSLRNPESHRIRDAHWQDRPLAAHQRFIVAMNSFRASGGGHVAALCGARALELPQRRPLREVLCDYLSGHLPREPQLETPPDWGFLPMPTTSITVATGPGARPYLDDLGTRIIGTDGPDGDGFLHLELGL